MHAHFQVSFHERKLADLEAIDDNRKEERHFGAVSRLLSELGAELYDLWLRPLVQAAVNRPTAEALRQSHPSRVQRLMFSRPESG